MNYSVKMKKRFYVCRCVRWRFPHSRFSIRKWNSVPLPWTVIPVSCKTSFCPGKTFKDFMSTHGSILSLWLEPVKAYRLCVDIDNISLTFGGRGVVRRFVTLLPRSRSPNRVPDVHPFPTHPLSNSDDYLGSLVRRTKGNLPMINRRLLLKI